MENDVKLVLDTVRDLDDRMTYHMKELAERIDKTIQLAEDIINGYEIKFAAMQENYDQELLGLKEQLADVQYYNDLLRLGVRI